MSSSLVGLSLEVTSHIVRTSIIEAYGNVRDLGDGDTRMVRDSKCYSTLVVNVQGTQEDRIVTDTYEYPSRSHRRGSWRGEREGNRDPRSLWLDYHGSGNHCDP